MLHPISAASEFPNDNPELHEGAIWVCATPCAVATAEMREREHEVGVEVEVEIGVEVEVKVEVEVEVEVEVGVAASNAPTIEAEAEVEVEAEVDDDEADIDDEDEGDDGDEIEIVDELEPIVMAEEHDDDSDDDAVDEPDASDDASDPFAFYVRTLTDVMIAAGGGDSAAHLVAALSEGPTACAWRRIISGESEDFAACGAKSLDEWSAELVARLIAMPTKTDQLRRELRSRGVAAFGLVVT